jgi:4-hydroxy-L-threonine phosphate dehydrogenase PdxA
LNIAIAIGDPNGIGPEIAVKAALKLRSPQLRPVLVGDAFVIREYAKDAQLEVVDTKSLAREAFMPGTCDPRAGKATVDYVREAVKLCEAGKVDAVVACPQSETAINGAGIAFSGYTPLVAELTGTPPDRAFLMLVAAGLRIAHVTLHESVQSALSRMTPELVVNAGLAAVDATKRLGVAKPRIGLFGINPHAGEGGLFGAEDARITEPAAAELKRRGVDVEGPVGGDLLLSQRRHDAYVAMFHDQGHIPVKLLSPLRASALAAGVPLLFSSVGHGCAYDIAGKGVADPTAVEETIRLLAGP